MTRTVHAVEWRFVVPGPPVSFRSPRRRQYQARVRSLAASMFRGQPTIYPVEVFLDYFHSTRRRVDMDNIAKCVLDGMNRIAYVDDRQVLHQYSRASDLSEPFWLSDGPVDLIKPLARFAEYLFVRIRAVRGAPHRRKSQATNRRT